MRMVIEHGCNASSGVVEALQQKVRVWEFLEGIELKTILCNFCCVSICRNVH